MLYLKLIYNIMPNQLYFRKRKEEERRKEEEERMKKKERKVMPGEELKTSVRSKY